MKSVAVNAPLCPPGPREGVSLRRCGHGGVESRVEHGDLRNRGQDLLDGQNPLQAGRIIKRRQFAQFTDGALDLGRNPHRGGKAPASVNHAVPDCVNFCDITQNSRGSGLQMLPDVFSGFAVLRRRSSSRISGWPACRNTSRVGRVIQSMLPSARSSSWSALNRLNLNCWNQNPNEDFHG